MMSLRWAYRIMRLLPKPVARYWRKRRFAAIRKRDGDAVVLGRILAALDMKLHGDGTVSVKEEDEP